MKYSKSRALNRLCISSITTHTRAGTWAEQAMGNLQKIIKAVSSQDESSEEGGPARKRVCVRVCEH